MKNYRYYKFLLVLGIIGLIVLALGAGVLPALAATNGDITFVGKGKGKAVSCVDSYVEYDVTFSGTINDAAARDHVAVIEIDGTGTPQDVDFYEMPVGMGGAIFADLDLGAGGASLDGAALPSSGITIALFDIPDKTGHIANDSYDWVIANGTFMAEDTLDLRNVSRACAGVPFMGFYSYVAAPQPFQGTFDVALYGGATQYDAAPGDNLTVSFTVHNNSMSYATYGLALLAQFPEGLDVTGAWIALGNGAVVPYTTGGSIWTLLENIPRDSEAVVGYHVTVADDASGAQCVTGSVVAEVFDFCINVGD